MAAWEPWVAAAFAPVAVWVLWRAQTASVNLLRRAMLRLLRHQAWLYNVVSWFGTFIHELSHASVLLLSGHGIKQFRAGVDQGHVTPRRMRKGPVGFLFFLVAAIAPLWIPPTLILAGMVWLVEGDLVPWQVPAEGLGAAASAWRDLFLEFPARLGAALASLDVTRWGHAVVLALIVLGIPGSRPSHVKGSRFHGEKDEGDIAVLRRRIRQNPWPLLLFLLVLYGLHFLLVPLWPRFYWYPFEAVWAVSLTGLVLALGSSLFWYLVAANGATRIVLAWLPLAALVVVQVVGRAAGWSLPQTNLASLLAFAALAVALRFVAPRKGIPF